MATKRYLVVATMNGGDDMWNISFENLSAAIEEMNFENEYQISKVLIDTELDKQLCHITYHGDTGNSAQTFRFVIFDENSGAIMPITTNCDYCDHSSICAGSQKQNPECCPNRKYFR